MISLKFTQIDELRLFQIGPLYLVFMTSSSGRSSIYCRLRPYTFPLAKPIITFLSILVLCFSAKDGKQTLHSINSELYGICKSMVETRGYKCEEHKVVTEDGYILSLQRMPEGLSGRKADKPPVLLQHGILSDSIVWLFNSPKESLAFILADKGYDVWLVNTRGTKYSRGHTCLGPNDKGYWEWSWDQLAAYDLPASVQYVYNNTKQKLHYVGHSLGTLIALASLSQGNLLNMLRSAALLCPTAHLDKFPPQSTKTAANKFLAEELYRLGLFELFPKMESTAKLLNRICKFAGLPCSGLMPLLIGPNCCVNASRIDVFLDHEPQPTSTKNLIHLSQMIRNKKIAKYDYGDEEQNIARYEQPYPPLYDMTRIPNDFPLFLSHGGKDLLSDVEDVQLLLEDLRDHDEDKLVVLFREKYGHSDFIMGINAKEVVYDPMMDFFELN